MRTTRSIEDCAHQRTQLQTLCQVSSRIRSWKLVTDPEPEARVPSVKKLNGELRLDSGQSCVDSLRHHNTSVHETKRYAFSVATHTAPFWKQAEGLTW